MRDDGLALVRRDAHPRGLIAADGGAQAVEIAVQEHRLHLAHALVERADLRDLLVGQLR